MLDSMEARPAFFLLLPFGLAWILTRGLISWAPRLGLIDLPNERKVHTRPVPRAGGLAIYAALGITALVGAGHLEPAFLRTLLIGGLIVVLGLADDLRPLPWQWRLGIQALATAGLFYWQPLAGGWRLHAIALLWVVGLINAFNMLDNMDALSAGVAGIATALMGVALWLYQIDDERWRPVLPNLMLLGALAGFLWFNRPPARIFMGDAGSTFLGFVLGVRSFDARLVDPGRPATWTVVLLLLAVPCYDLTTVVLLRLWQGRSPFHADKQHLSHRLVSLGLSKPGAVGVIYLFALASGLSGVLLYAVGGSGSLLVAAPVLIWWLAIAAIEYVRHFRRPLEKEPAADQRTAAEVLVGPR